jgi:hypothetical protein
VVLMALVNRRLSFGKAALAFVASLVPFGPFLLDRSLVEDERNQLPES